MQTLIKLSIDALTMAKADNADTGNVQNQAKIKMENSHFLFNSIMFSSPFSVLAFTQATFFLQPPPCRGISAMQESQLSQRGRAMLRVTQGHSK